MWASAITDYSSWLTAAGASRGTVRLRRYYLRRVAQAVPDPWQATVQNLADFLAEPAWRPETRKSARSTIVSFYAWATLTERVQHSPAALLPGVRVPRAVPRPAPERVLEHALHFASTRDRRMILCAAYAGMRRAEIAVAHTRDVEGDMIHVHGKGGNDRLVPLHPLLGRALAGVEPGWLFPGRIDGHMSPDSVGRILKRHLGPNWSAHTLRHRFASRAYEVDRDLLAVSRLLGHANVRTTQGYTLVPDAALRRAVAGIA